MTEAAVLQEQEEERQLTPIELDPIEQQRLDTAAMNYYAAQLVFEQYLRLCLERRDLKVEACYTHHNPNAPVRLYHMKDETKP